MHAKIQPRKCDQHEYVYHCHILSHEDHEMMRRYIVDRPGAPATGGTVCNV